MRSLWNGPSLPSTCSSFAGKLQILEGSFSADLLILGEGFGLGAWVAWREPFCGGASDACCCADMRRWSTMLLCARLMG